MSNIIIKKKKNYIKKRLLKRVGILILIYFVSFFTLYAIFGEKPKINDNVEKDVYINDGERYLANKNYPDALEYFVNMHERNEDDYYALNRIGKVYFEIKDYDKAKFYFFLSKDIAPFFTANYVDLALLYMDTNDLTSAENIIRLMPVKKKNDLVKKGYIYKKLAQRTEELEGKIVFYNLAIDYLKDFDVIMYNQALEGLFETYYKIADNAIKEGDLELAKNAYDSILKHKNSTKLQIEYAKFFIDSDRAKSMHAIKQAFYLAKKQEDKRLVKEQLINMFFHFEKEGDTFNQKVCKTFLAQLGTNAIQIDQRETVINVDDVKFYAETVEYKVIPHLSFYIKNNSSDILNTLYVKAVLSSTDKHFSEEVQFQLYPTVQAELKPKEKSKLFIIPFKKNIKNENRMKEYTLNLYFSSNSKNWILYKTIE